MKKYFALLLSVIMIMHTAVVFANDTAVNEAYITGQKAENIQILLNKLDIVTDEGDLGDIVSKGKFLSYMVKLLKMGIIPATEQLFFDVPITNEYADIVNTAYVTGIVNGNADGTLAVDTPVTANEAIAISVRALEGICYVSANSSDSFSEYTNLAARLDLLDGVKVSEDGTFNRGAVLRLIYNILNAQCISTDNWKDFYWEEATFMENRYKIRESKGVVEACSYGEIYGGEVLNGGRVKIDGETFAYDDIEAKKLLGHKVTYYYNIDDEGTGEAEIIYMFSAGTGVITLNLEDIEYHKQGIIKYTDNDDRSSDLDLSESATTLLNGKRVAVGADGMQIPLYGNVTCVDNDNDGRYDVILYNKYSIAVATGVNPEEKKIYSQKGDYTLLDLEEYKSYYICDKDGNSLDITAITKDSVLNINENGYETVVEITVCTDTAELIVKSMWEESLRGYTAYNLESKDGITYRTIFDFVNVYDKNSFMTESTSAALSSKYKVALNIDGKIAAVLERTDASGYMYGYVVDFLYDGQFNEKSKVRILSENNEFNDYEVADKINVAIGSSSSKITEENFMTGYEAYVEERGVVRFRTNDEGQLSAVELSQATGAKTGLREDKQITTGESESTRFYTASNMLGGQVIVNGETKVFVVPSGDNKGDKTYYYASRGTVMENQKYYPGSVSYKYDDDVYADVLVISADEDIIKTAPIMLVEKVFSLYDPEEDEIYEALSGYVNGNMMTYCIESGDYPVVSKASGFEAAEGDVIRFIINQKGHIGLMEPVFDCSEKKLYNYDMASTRRYAYHNGICQVYGQMYDIYDGVYMNVEDSKDAEQFKYYYPITADTRFYEYDEGSSRGTIKEITSGDVLTVKSGQVTSEKVVIVTRDSTTPLVVVYK